MTKNNSSDATLRKDTLPQPEAVRDAVCEEGAAVRAAKKQNISGGKDGGKAVLENTGPLAPPKA